MSHLTIKLWATKGKEFYIQGSLPHFLLDSFVYFLYFSEMDHPDCQVKYDSDVTGKDIPQKEGVKLKNQQLSIEAESSEPNQKMIPVEWNLQRMKGILVAVGGFLVCLCFGSDFSYPNLNSYLTSYMRLNGYYYNSVNGNRNIFQYPISRERVLGHNFRKKTHFSSDSYL